MSEPRAGDDLDAEDGADRTPRRRKHRSWARRKHLGWITFGVALLVLVGGVLSIVLTWDNGRTPLSQQAAAIGTQPAASTAPTAPGSASPTVAATPVAVTVRGTIQTIGDNQVTVKSATQLTYRVSVTPTTAFKIDHGFETFQVGDAVVVKGALFAGTLTATAFSEQR